MGSYQGSCVLTTNLVWQLQMLRFDSILIESSNRVAATRPFSILFGFCVKLGFTSGCLSEMSSKPVIWISCGTLKPNSFSLLYCRECNNNPSYNNSTLRLLQCHYASEPLFFCTNNDYCTGICQTLSKQATRILCAGFVCLQ